MAFVGGIGVADQWAFDTEKERMWRDTQIEVRGPAAVYIEGSFNENWIESGEVVAPDLLPHDDRARPDPRDRSSCGAGPRAAPAR